VALAWHEARRRACQARRNLRSLIKEKLMKRIVSITVVAIAAASLAACDSQGPGRQPAPKQQFGAAPQKPATPAADYQSSVAPRGAPDAIPVADKELSNKVRNVLTTSNGIEIGGVEVAAADGVITINGTVQMPAEKDRAAILALGIDGVRSVVNNLVVIRGS